MDKDIIAATLKKVKDNSPKRNFKQSLDLIMNLKGLDLKKAEHQVSLFVALHYDTGKDVSVCALVDTDLEAKAKEVCSETILADQFEKFKNKAAAKKLAAKYDFFVAQASIMPKIATIFGRYLGPKGKMPNPKIGSVLNPNSNVKQLHEKLKKTILLATKNEPTIKCRVGNEDTKEEEIIDNIMTVYNNVIQKLPGDKQNVKSVMLKLTMGPSFVVGSLDAPGKAKGNKNEKTPDKKAAEVPKEEKKQGQKAKPEAREDKEDKKPISKKPDTKKSK
jgi:large subunit ribosomal protein L1